MSSAVPGPLASATKKIIATSLAAMVCGLIYSFWGSLGELTGWAVPPAVGRVGYTVAGILFWVFAARAAMLAVNTYVWTGWVELRKGSQVPKLLRDLTTAVLAIVCIIAITSDVFGIEIGGVLTASGIVIAIVGFALRSMIADVFTGIALGVEQPAKVGDWIQLNDGTIGRVIEMNWRATRLLTTDEVTVVVPNNFLASTPFRNYHSPDSHWRDQFQIVLGYEVTAHQAERILLSAVSQIAESINLPREPEARIIEYTDHGIKWEVRYWVPDFPSRSRIRYAIQRNVLRNLHFAGASVPRPRLETLDATDPAAKRDPLHEDLALLRGIELFSAFSDAELSGLVRRMRTRLFLKGRPVIQQGETGDSLFVVKEGFLDVFIRNESGVIVRVGQQVPGMYFGEMALLTGEARTATVTPSVDSVVLEIGKDDLEPMLLARPDAVRMLSEQLASRQLRNEKTLSEHSQRELATQKDTLAQRLQARILTFFGLKPRAVTG